jgi:hypothetical protein
VLPLDHFQGDAEVVKHGHEKIVKQNSCQLPVARSSFSVACPAGRLAAFAVFLMKKASRIATPAGCNEFSGCGSSSFSAAGLECFSGRSASIESPQKQPFRPDAFAWLGRHQPVCAVVKTILPFYIRDEPVGSKSQVSAVFLAYFP